jgi:hypothetical protein
MRQQATTSASALGDQPGARDATAAVRSLDIVGAA